jgi:hypothetical protein
MNSGTVSSEYWVGLLRDHQLKLTSNSPRGGERRYPVTIQETMEVYEREEMEGEEVPIVMVGSKVDGWSGARWMKVICARPLFPIFLGCLQYLYGDVPHIIVTLRTMLRS